MEIHHTQRKELNKHNIIHTVLRQHLSLLFNGETPEAFPPKLEQDTDAHFSTANIVLEVLANAIRQEKIIRVLRIGKE